MRASYKPSSIKRRWLVFALVILAIGAAVWLGPQISFWIRYGGMPIAAAVGGIADCSWGSTAAGWIDANQDGRHDPGEQPMPGVAYHIDDVLNHSVDVGWPSSVSNSKGEAGLVVWLPGCPRARFEIYPDIPAGYRLTTKARLSADVRQFGQVLEFGFTYLPGVPTATPGPRPPQCQSYPLGIADQYDVTDVAIAADGSVWGATYGRGVALYLPHQDAWTRYSSQNGFISDKVRSISPMPDGSLWFAADGGAIRWDRSRGWASYDVRDGLVHGNVYRIAQASDGSIWSATQGGVSHFKPADGTWTSYTSQYGLAGDFVTYVSVAPDGAVWFATLLDDVSRLAPQLEPSAKLRWTTYSRFAKGATNMPAASVDQIEAAPNGMLWFAGLGQLLRLDSRTGQWTTYDENTTNGAFAGQINDFDIAADGSIWIASGSGSPIIYHFTPATGDHGRDIWRVYDSRDGLPQIHKSGVREDGAVAIASAPDGKTVWVATREAETRCVFQ